MRRGSCAIRGRRECITRSVARRERNNASRFHFTVLFEQSVPSSLGSDASSRPGSLGSTLKPPALLNAVITRKGLANFRHRDGPRS